MSLHYRPSPNYNDRRDNKGVSMLVLHYTGMTSAEAALERLCDPEAQVSAHYVVDEQGDVFQLVDEDKRAWHAGAGSWRGERDINSASIGIEIVNPGHEFGYVAFPKVQMQAVTDLSSSLVKRYGIKPFNVVGHSDIAPLRKKDPGELFNWQQLATRGAGLWVKALPSGINDVEGLIPLLSELGYECEGDVQISKVIAAFQRHWRPGSITGEYDQETSDIAYALVQEVKRLT